MYLKLTLSAILSFRKTAFFSLVFELKFYNAGRDENLGRKKTKNGSCYRSYKRIRSLKEGSDRFRKTVFFVFIFEIWEINRFRGKL
ncbi:hypothetical protein HOLDEFILI_03496 [Holdemania filiformis DSM 12042]|uniref:Uncharacterized protein n=1 Tax=Holdemania filiformis DSM 12042 TaxID=545696 RepID=B9YCD7_9FIRM|nr:hypothetical protein HOLDEFILI_03496 [Holdemania filiformis DSM 12042]